VSGLVHGGLRVIFLPPLEHALRVDTPATLHPADQTRRLHSMAMRRPHAACDGLVSGGRRLDVTGCQLIGMDQGRIAEVRGHYSDQDALDAFWATG
jgi:hypothetical protein